MKENKKKFLILFIYIFIIISGIVISISTVSQAKLRVIEETNTIEETKEGKTNNKIEEIEEPAFDETTIEEPEIEEEPVYKFTNIELSIILISLCIIIGITITLITTKLASVPIHRSLSKPKTLFYYCGALIIFCSIIPAISIINMDKILQKASVIKNDLFLAVVEIKNDRNDSNVKEESTENNTSVIQVSNQANYEVSNLEITKESGETTAKEDTLKNGLNAAFLAKERTNINIDRGQIISKAPNAPSFFLTENSKATLNNLQIETQKENSPALNVTENSELTAINLNITTKANNSHALNTQNNDNSLITINDSNVVTYGKNASIFYSKAKIEATNITGEAKKASIGIIENRNDLTIKDSNLITYADEQNEWNKETPAFLIQDKEQTSAYNTATNAKLTISDSFIEINENSQYYETAPLFYVTNSNANINITNTELKYGSNILLKLEKNNITDTGAIVTFTATDEKLIGNVELDEYSQIRLNLNNSTYEGQMNKDNISKNVDVTFDYHSSWILTGDSYVNTLTVTKKDLKNVRKYIKSNGYNVYYNTFNNEWLNNKTYRLNGGGKLIPITES